MQNVAHAYKQAHVGTMGQGEVVVLLYDGALRFLSQAREKIQARDYAAKGILISKALDIINELDSCLNMEAGGEIAAKLHQLYFICSTRLLRVNLKLDLDVLETVETILKDLREAFAQALTLPEAKAAAESIGARTAAHNSSMKSRPLGSGGLNLGKVTPANDLRLHQSLSFSGGGLSAPILPPNLDAHMAPARPAAPGQPPKLAKPFNAYAMAEKNQGDAAPAAKPASTAATPSSRPPAPQATAQFQQLVKAEAARDTAEATPPVAGIAPKPVVATPQAAPPLQGPTGGFANKKLAMYNKLMGNG